MPTTLDFTKSENQLKVLDTFHDFCTKERKKKTSSKKISEDAEEEVSENKLDIVRKYIVDFLANKYTNFATINKSDPKKALAEIVKTITSNNVENLSDLENKTINYFETDTTRSKQIDADKGTRQSITFQTIVDGNPSGGENDPLWREFRRNRNEVSILEINKGTKSIDKYNDTDRKKIASFILNFFFSQVQGDMRCTFDAKSGVVSKIFENVDQVKNVIFPQTIADSATTTFGTMKGRNEFIFPGTRTFPMNSTLYSEGKYALTFINDNFDSRNPYGFHINVKNTNIRKDIDLPFSASQTEGPSVNYLIDILEAVQKKRSLLDIPKKNQILSLGKYIEKNADFKSQFITDIGKNEDGLLLDIKRGGDHEAVAATKNISTTRYPFFIFVTIDLLCALEARRQNIPTIWHYGERMILYRFPVAISEALAKEQKLKDTQDKINDALSSIDIMEQIAKIVSEQLALQLGEVQKGKTALVDVYNPKEVLPSNNEGIEKILIFLLQLRMTYFETQITSATGKLPAIPSEIPQFKEFLTKAKKIEDLNQWTFGTDQNYSISVKIKGTSIDIKDICKKVSDTFEDFINKVNKALKLNAPISITTSGQEIKKTYQIYRLLVPCLDKTTGASCSSTTSPANKVFINDEVENSAFEYDALPFYSLYRTLILISQATEKATKERKTDSRTYNNFMKEKYNDLAGSVQAILNQFDEATQATLKSKKLFQIPITEYTGLIESIDTSSVPAVYRKTAGGSYQVGGDAQQYYDLADTLLLISTDAAAFIESCFSSFYPDIAFSTAIKELTNYKSSVTDDEGVKKLLLSYLQTTLGKGYYFADHPVNAAVKTALDQINGDITEPLSAATPLDKAKLLGAIAKFEAIQTAHLAAVTQPSIEEFYNKIMEMPELIIAARDCVQQMQYTWESALYFIKTSQEYSYIEDKDNRSLSSEETITYLLSLSVVEGNEHLPESLVSQSVVLADIETELATNPKRKSDMETLRDTEMVYRQQLTSKASIRYNVSIPILMVFTLLENIQNPKKYSFFLKERHKNLYYVSQADWNTTLWNDIKNIITNIKTNLKVKNQITLAGGGKKKYAKKTRKQKRKHTKKSKRITRRRKH